MTVFLLKDTRKTSVIASEPVTDPCLLKSVPILSSVPDSLPNTSCNNCSVIDAREKIEEYKKMISLS